MGGRLELVFRGLRVNCLRGVESLPRRNLRVSSVSVFSV